MIMQSYCNKNMIGDLNTDANFPQKLLLTDRQVSRHMTSGNITPETTLTETIKDNKDYPKLKRYNPFFFFFNAGVGIIPKMLINKEISSIMGSGIPLTNNEIKDIVKLLRSLENIEILFKGTTE